MTTIDNNTNNERKDGIAISFSPEEHATVQEVLRRILLKQDLLSQSETLRYRKLLEKFS